MNPGDLDTLCDILQLVPERGTAGEVLVGNNEWKLVEQMMLGQKEFNGKALAVGGREAADIEIVWEGWARLHVVKPRMRMTAEGVTYEITRVDPAHGKLWMLVYTKVVK